MKKYLFFILLFIAFNTYPQQDPDIAIELYAAGFNKPLYVTSDGIASLTENRLYVVEQGGRIKLLLNGITNPVPFLNISSQVSNGNEQGLLGLAFHPDYANNGYFFVNYTKANGDTQVSRFSVDATNPDLADANSELPIIGYTQPYTNHNGGHIAFGPDGYLYIGSGDGGSGGDPGNRAQDINSLLGKLLRIDIDNPSGGNNYGIPTDNPFLGNPNAKEEIWAYGLRNPWRFSFDFGFSNFLWTADVGQSNIEEVNMASVTDAGLNYGWRCFEGSQPYNTQNCPPQSELIFPVYEYTHSNGNCSITGGYVYRGASHQLVFEGDYFFADYCSGKIARVNGNGQFIDEVYFSGKKWVSFGEDVENELYIVDGSAGEIYLLKYGGVLSAQGYSIEKSLSIHPNPASANVIFNLKNDNLSTIQIFDIRGSLISSENNINTNKKIVSVENFNSGIYFAKITSTKGQSIVKKLIIQ